MLQQQDYCPSSSYQVVNGRGIASLVDCSSHTRRKTRQERLTSRYRFSKVLLQIEVALKEGVRTAYQRKSGESEDEACSSRSEVGKEFAPLIGVGGFTRLQLRKHDNLLVAEGLAVF